MRIADIKRGKWYKTTKGTGQAVTVGGTRPPSVQVNITHPFPRGKIFVSPREVEEEVPDPTTTVPRP